MGSFFPSSLTQSTVPSRFVALETVYLETLDGVSLEADVLRTDAPKVRATVVIGHPHPLYGGQRTDRVVQAMQRAAFQRDCHSIAPDFRGAGNSGGLHDDGNAERLDLMAMCELADMMEPDGPIIMSGYSFGSVVALNVTHPLIAGWVALAPPLPMMTSRPLASRYSQPKILIAPEHDQFTRPNDLRESVSTWTNTTVVELPGVDHFIALGGDDACLAALDALLAPMF